MNKEALDIKLSKVWEERYSNTLSAYNEVKSLYNTAKDLKYSKGISYSLLYKSLFTFWLEKDKEVITPILKAIELFKELNDELGLTRAYNILSNVYDNYGDYSAATSYSQNAVNIAKKKNYIEELGDAYTSLGQVYNRLEDYNTSAEILKKGLAIRKKIKAVYAQSSSLNLIARTYTQAKQFDKSLEYYNKSLDLRRSINDQNGLPWSYLGIASLYQEIGEYEQSKKYYNKALSNKNENKRLELLCNVGIGKIALQENELDIAKNILTKSLKLAKALKIKSVMYDLHFSIADVYQKENNPTKELEHFKAFYKLKEEILNAETTNKLKKQQVAFSVERSRKEAEIYQLKNVELKKAYNIVHEKNTEITDSINYAKRIQDALFPTLSYFHKSFPNSYLIYKPKDIVAGDFYWIDERKDQLFFAVADCTGHGVPGAMVSVICNNALNRAVREFKISSPAKILDKVTELVRTTFEKSEEKVPDGMDIALCAYNKSTKELEYSGANNSLYVISQKSNNLAKYRDHKTLTFENSSLFVIPATKQSVGGFDFTKPFVNHKLQLEKGDFICLFSDGYADQFGGDKGKKLKYKPFKELLLKTHQIPHIQQQKVIDTAFENWKGDLEQIDDVCVMGINID